MPLDPLDPSEFITGPIMQHKVLQPAVGPEMYPGGIHPNQPSGGAAPARGPQISEHAEQALEQPAGFEQHMIGQRLPSEPNLPTQPQPRLVDIESMRATPAAPAKKGVQPPAFLDRAFNLLRSYPDMPRVPGKDFERAAVEQMKNNLLWLYDNYRWRDRAMQWYDGGNKMITDKAQQYNLSPRATAGVYAVLSPQKDWFENVSLGDRVLRTVMDPQVRSMSMTNEMVNLYRSMGKESWGKAFDAIAGKSYDQIEEFTRSIPVSDDAKAEMKAMWVRLYDEAHTPQDYRTLSPEGEFGQVVVNKDGTPSKLRWQGNDAIGKAIRMIETNGADAETLAGGNHKVRNFYNNLLVPNSTRGDVTIDTHAIAAAHLRALAGEDPEVKKMLSNPEPASAVTGMKGPYGIYADAYRQAAAERGILPRQMQSVTWEAVRGLYSRTFKGQKKNKDLIDGIWRQYADGQATIEQTRDAILRAAGGIDAPSWAVPAARADEIFRYPGDPRELSQFPVHGQSAGGVDLGAGVGAPPGIAPGVTENAAAALGQGAQ